MDCCLLGLSELYKTCEINEEFGNTFQYVGPVVRIFQDLTEYTCGEKLKCIINFYLQAILNKRP